MNPIKIITSMTAIALLVTLAACTPPGGQPQTSPTPSVAKHPVSIAAPPSADVSNVQVKVTGTAGDTLDIYAFDGGWDKDKTPTCTATDSPVRSVQLGPTGTETINVSVDHPGVWWWVVSSIKEGLTSKCGTVSTNATYQPKFVFAGPINPRSGLNGYQGTLEVGKPVTYWVTSDSEAPADLGGWPVTVKWIGPFSSGPEARTGCSKPNSPVGATSKGKATYENASGGGGGGKFTVTLPAPGVYAVVATSAGTDWSPPVTTPCDESTPYLIAK